jgi:RNA polymerase sigma-70 factor (ECF subfamily)
MERLLSEYSDSDLFALLRSEQAEKAFGEIYARYSSAVYAYSLRVMSDRDRAYDIFQDTFMRFYESATRHPSLDNVKGYLLTICRNLCLNEKKRASSLTVEFDEETYSPGQSKKAERDEMMQLIAMALELVSHDMKEAFVLREYQGLTYREISSLLEIKVETAKVRVFRTRQKIKEILQPYIEEMRD